jgi:ribosomal protein S8
MNIKCLEYQDDFYPILISNNIIIKELYEKLKTNFPDFSKYKAEACGQLHRLNIVVKKDNENYNKLKIHNPEYIELFEYIDSIEFKNYLKNKFKNDFEKYGFIGDIENNETEMSICKSTDLYENPWHVDTRKRIYHILIYFGDELIEEGGELMIGKHKKLNNKEYPQYPEKQNIIETKLIKPNNNNGVIILSTPNSYHKGCFTKGMRKFIYIGYNNINGSAWEHDKNWNQKKSFHQRLQEEYKK